MRKTLYFLVKPFVWKFCPERYHGIEIDEIMPNSEYRLKAYGFNPLKSTKPKWYDEFLSPWRNLPEHIILALIDEMSPGKKLEMLMAWWHDPKTRKRMERLGYRLIEKGYN